MSSSPTIPASHSQASLSPSNSMSHQEDVSLQTLVSHLLASKRSLSSINTVWRANEIVTSARAALEESVVLSARTGFLRNGIFGQVKILKRVRNGVENNVIRTLDAANARLESTMDVLRSTMVEAAFRPTGEEPRSLLDFVDEQGVETMRDALKESIRETKEAQTDFDTSILSFDDDLRALKIAMTSTPQSASQSLSTHSSPIPTHLHTLESHAQEMASLLDSLVSHFDLCVNAIRHTEGGYAAVRKAASSQPPGSEPVSVSGVINTESAPDEPISSDERRQMLDVLEHDASQVEDVVEELREFLAEMEGKHEAILEHVASLTTAYNNTTNAYHILEGVGARLSGYIIASQEFRLRWDETKAQIQDQLSELESMRLFYENYFSSYDSLILEVYRRKECEEKVKGIVDRAMEQMGRLYEADMKEREGFRLDVGDFLPVDLYPGVNKPAPVWEFVLRNGDGVVEGSVPALERGAIEAAGKREKDRQKNER
ncbi:Autophagy-related protein 17 [Lachnellula cervina]|uniref:Autophagy-related protein 17 n=1 Tax=Lachnellula cervina TaxID=1316786 RepID=A0A7D8Z152_9HELO|nr:Autophagy-related protein 17 [Lachnellula cervina]